MFANGPADYEVVKEIARLTRTIKPFEQTGRSVRAVSASIIRALTNLRQDDAERLIVNNFQGNVLIVKKGDQR